MTEPAWLPIDVVIDTNRRAVAETGEPFFLRDRALLESAVKKPKNHYCYGGELDVFADAPLAAIFLAGLVVLSAAAETGHRLGVRAVGEANVLTLEAAMLGLLALMLSFTFAMAAARFDARRDALLREANAIGTAALRARLLPAPHDAQSVMLLRDYVQIRLGVAGRSTREELEAAIDRSNAIQERLWVELKAVAANNDAMVPTGLYIQALNAMFDLQQSRVTAYRERVPDVIVWALYGIAAVSVGYAGFASGVERRRWRLPVYSIIVLAISVILLIEDLDRPASGFFVVDRRR